MVVAAGSATLKKPRELSAGVPASSISAPVSDGLQSATAAPES